MLAAKNHQKIRSRYLVHEYSLKVSFNDFNHGYRAAVLKKNYPSLLPFSSLWLLIANIKWCAEWCAQQLYHTSLNSLIIEAKFGDDLLEILNISPKLSALFTLNDKNPETLKLELLQRWFCVEHIITPPTFTCSKLTMQTTEHGMKYFKVNNKDPRTTPVASML